MAELDAVRLGAPPRLVDVRARSLDREIVERLQAQALKIELLVRHRRLRLDRARSEAMAELDQVHQIEHRLRGHDRGELEAGPLALRRGLHALQDLEAADQLIERSLAANAIVDLAGASLDAEEEMRDLMLDEALRQRGE